MRNLISNAIKFTNTEGSININIDNNVADIIISVIDNGIGLNLATQKKLWNKDEQITISGTDGEKGSGFGLLLCKEFIEKHQGKIWVESKIGKGSKFSFLIPLDINIK